MTSLLKTLTPLCTPHKFLSLSSSIFLRTLTSSSPQISPKTTQNNSNKKSLSVFFVEAVELCPRTEDTESESENSELKKTLIELEREVRELKKSKPLKGKEPPTSEKPKKSVKKEKMEKGKSLYALFTGKEGQNREDVRREKEEEENEVLKELSPEMELLVRFLYEQGYFNNVSFLPGNRLEFRCFENSYGRDYIKFAADKFGGDHQEIAKWLSGSDLKKVALFGCPSLARKNVFSAKRLRKFFEIQEDTVCSKCMIKESCKFVNQSVWKGDTKTLNLAVVMRVITLYALESVHRKLIVPDEIKVSVSKLLKEIIKLSQTTA